MTNTKLLVVFMMLVFSLTVVAQKKEKSFKNWSKEEAMEIATNSAWAKTYQSTQGLIAAEQTQVAREQADQVILNRGSQATASNRGVPAPIVIRLNSALAIRQALVRQQQIAAKYDKMSDADKAKFDESSKDFLACAACKNLYVITITKFRNSGLGIDEGIFQSTKFDQIKDKIRIANEKGEFRTLVQFIPPKQGGESAVFFFQRFDSNGKELITPENKELSFLISPEFLDARNPYASFLPRKFDFKVSKLVVDGKVEF